jgi:hypothetical protein
VRPWDVGKDATKPYRNAAQLRGSRRDGILSPLEAPGRFRPGAKENEMIEALALLIMFGLILIAIKILGL